MTVDPTLMMLFSRVLRIDNARVQGLVLVLPPEKDEPEPDEPLWIEPPLEMTVNDFAAGRRHYLPREGEARDASGRSGSARPGGRASSSIETLAVKPGDIEGDLVVSGPRDPGGGHGARRARRCSGRKSWCPETLAGRVLASRGALTLNGTPKAYAAAGELDVGPPNELTHVVLDLTGTDILAHIRSTASCGSAPGSSR